MRAIREHARGDQAKGRLMNTHAYILITPNRVTGIGALSAAE